MSDIIQKKRILFVVYELPPIGGGVANSALHLLQEFSRWPNFIFDVVTSSLNNTFSERKLSPNITIHYVPIGPKPPSRYQKQTPQEMIQFLLFSGWKIAQLQLRYRYKLAHYFGYPGALIGWVSGWRTPYVISLRGVDVPGYNQSFGIYYYFFKPIAILTWKSAKAITALSNFLARLAHQTVHNVSISVIPNSVDTKTFQPLPENKKYPVFTVTAGGTIMGKKKGLIHLIEGFAAFHHQYPKSKLFLFGEGNEYTSLKKRVNQLHINKAVTFTKRVSHKKLAKLLPKCHVFCLPSYAEGMSNAMLEAQAAGLAIVTTPVGFGYDLIQDSLAIGIKVGDHLSITTALEKLYTDTAYRKKLGLAVSQLVKKQSWLDIAQKYKQIYDKL